MLNRWAIQMTLDERIFWNRWVIFTGVAFICFAVPIHPLLSVGLGGFALGVLQWLNLRQQVTWAIHWIWATPVGALFMFVVMLSIAAIDPPFSFTALYEVLSYPTLGLSIGFMQWLVLRRYVQHAEWWILANALIYLFGFIIVSAFQSLASSLGSPSPNNSFIIRIVFFAAMGLIVGMANGIVIARLLRNPIQLDH